MSGRPWLSAQARREIGAVVRQARAGGTDWKLLERTYDRDRTVLWRYACGEDCNIFSEDCNIIVVAATTVGAGI
jgi:hypothetical protein